MFWKLWDGESSWRSIRLTAGPLNASAREEVDCAPRTHMGGSRASCLVLCDHGSVLALLDMSPAEALMAAFFRLALRSSLLNSPPLSVQPQTSPVGLVLVHVHAHVTLTALVLQVGFLTTFAILLHEIPHEVSC